MLGFHGPGPKEHPALLYHQPELVRVPRLPAVESGKCPSVSGAVGICTACTEPKGPAFTQRASVSSPHKVPLGLQWPCHNAQRG